MRSERSFKNPEGVEFVEVRSRGIARLVPSVNVFGRRIVVSGRVLRIARLQDEEWIENPRIENPEEFAAQLKVMGLKADVFTFCGMLGDSSDKHGYPTERENAAVIKASDYDSWWNALPQESRKNVRRAAKRGVELRIVKLDENLARGIKQIYDESPIRQGRGFWHYGKDIDTIMRENDSYSERSDFLGAFADGELIGFMKWVYVRDVARIMQIIALNSHHERRPMNALIAKAVEVVHSKGFNYLVYGKFSYGRKGDDSMTEFKRRMGFEQLDYQRYYIPLTARGSGLLWLGLHKELIGILPRQMIGPLRQLRARWLSHRESALRKQ